MGRPLTDDEAAFVDRTIEIRRGVIGTEDVILLAREIQSGVTSASASISSDPGLSPASDEPNATTDEPVIDETEGVDAGFPPIPLFEAPGPRPIGVPADFVASRQVPDALGATRPGDPTRVQTFEPQYFEGDELAPASLDGTVIARLQKRLVAAGLLKEDDYYSGYWDDLTAAAYKKALGYSNQSPGLDVSATIDELIRTLPQSVKDARDLDKFAEPPFLKADIATLAQKVKTTLRNELGRDPTAAELAELTGAMRGFRREGFDAFVESERAAFNKDRGIVDPSRIVAPMGVVSGGLTVEPQTLQDVDPAARFQEFFEKRFKPEIDRLDSLGEVRRNANNVFASLRTMSSLVGGR